MLATSGAGCFGQFVGLEAIDQTKVGEEQDPVVRGADEEVADNIVLLQLGTTHTLAAAFLAAVEVNLGALGITGRGQGDDDVFTGDEVFVGHISATSNELGATLIAVFFDDFSQLIADDLALALGASKNILVVLNSEQEFLQLVDNLLTLQGSQTTQLHRQDSVRLDIVDI